MADRICFLGRGGSGKSTVAQNISHALAQKGYRVLLVGNDISLSSTVLLGILRTFVMNSHPQVTDSSLK